MAHGTDRWRPGPAGKPLDVGNGHAVASLAATTPALISLLCYHPDQGVAELSATPQFDEARRGDARYVRQYRQSLASDRHTCLQLETADGVGATAREIDLSDPQRPIWHGRLGDLPFLAQAWADDEGIVINWRASGAGLAKPAPRLRLQFAGRLDRPALAEITELAPPPPTGSRTTLTADGPHLRVHSTLPAAVTLEAGDGEWLVSGTSARLELPGVAEDQTVTVRCRAGAHHTQRRTRRLVDARPPGPLGPVVARALTYVRDCTALRTGTDEVAILTDHRILPLSWTRDSYYQALLLLATGETADTELVADHLRWLWRRCERPAGQWLRSHHANGRPKDRAFQADQQIYPLLELADYWRITRRVPAGVDWNAEVGRAWEATLAKVDPTTGLMATTENAADDPAPAPFTASSQVLLWYAASRLAELADDGALAIGADGLRAVTRNARLAFDRTLVDHGRWLYATDGSTTRVAYHDANDLPVAMAPLLGFCAADDRGWQATMTFAFSRENPGYFSGQRSGLGSKHTPAPWTLGDIQAWLWAHILGDEAGQTAALDRLASVSFHDGMLPEAYSATTDPDLRIRSWFAWPGAALGALLLLDARGELGRLRAVP